MADEIRLCNVARVQRQGRSWRASIGPKVYGLTVAAATPAAALIRLALLCDEQHWPWDQTWLDRLE